MTMFTLNSKSFPVSVFTTTKLTRKQEKRNRGEKEKKSKNKSSSTARDVYRVTLPTLNIFLMVAGRQF